VCCSEERHHLLLQGSGQTIPSLLMEEPGAEDERINVTVQRQAVLQQLWLLGAGSRCVAKSGHGANGISPAGLMAGS
jgi:hypothetical protein